MAHCAIDGCDYPTRWRDLCNAHSVRFLRTGERGGKVNRRGPKRAHWCEADGCDKPHYCGGLCSRHYQQLRMRGELEPPRLVGEQHPSWRGDEVAYRTVHTRLQSQRGPASARACVDCGLTADEWSYDHKADVEFFDDNGSPYSTDLTHYEPRCRSCHKRFDGIVPPRAGVGASRSLRP